MQAGGKIDEGENAVEALVRELEEELAVRIDPHNLQALGQFAAIAANEDGHELVAELLSINADFTAQPEAEIAEAIWVSPKAALALPLAPLTREHVMPIVEKLTARKRNKA